jgi:hypothetical protein
MTIVNSENNFSNSANLYINNEGFVVDEIMPPPSYSSIFPFQDDHSALKIYSITTTPEAIQINTGRPPSANNTLRAINLEPISYDELFQTSSHAPTRNMTGNSILSSECSSSRINSQSSSLLMAQSTQVLIANNLIKQIRIHFKQSYLISHFLFIILTSLTIITFQIILMNNNTKFSYLGCGIWCGLTNLATLIVSIATSK